jgi:hypothetical protein
MFTGADFDKSFDRRVDQPYTDYYSPAQKRVFYKKVIRQAIMDKLKLMNNQFRFDEIKGLVVRKREIDATSGRIMTNAINVVSFNFATQTITTNIVHNALVGQTINLDLQGSLTTFTGTPTVVSVTDNTIVVSGVPDIGVFESGSIITLQTVSDYLNFQAVKVVYELPTDIEIEGMQSDVNKIVLILKNKKTLRTGMKVIISGVLGNTNANGERFVKQVGANSFQLYSDSTLRVPIVSNSFYLGGGEIVRHLESDCFQKQPDQRVDAVNKPTFMTPYYEMAENAIVFDPKENIVKAKLDYVKEPNVYPDPDDDLYDLENDFSLDFLEYAIDVGARLFSLEIQDLNQLGADNQQVIINQ